MYDMQSFYNLPPAADASSNNIAIIVLGVLLALAVIIIIAICIALALNYCFRRNRPVNPDEHDQLLNAELQPNDQQQLRMQERNLQQDNAINA